jgi:hypothetical protein
MPVVAAPLNCTPVTSLKLVPVMVMTVPGGPLVGVKPEIVGSSAVEEKTTGAEV